MTAEPLWRLVDFIFGLTGGSVARRFLPISRRPIAYCTLASSFSPLKSKTVSSISLSNSAITSDDGKSAMTVL